MKLRLTTSDLARHDNCICPNNHRRAENMGIVRMAPIILGVLLAVDLVIALFAPGIALAFVCLFGLVGLSAFVFRIIRGHTLQCSLYWGFLGGLGLIGNMLVYGF